MIVITFALKLKRLIRFFLSRFEGLCLQDPLFSVEIICLFADLCYVRGTYELNPSLTNYFTKPMQTSAYICIFLSSMSYWGETCKKYQKITRIEAFVIRFEYST